LSASLGSRPAGLYVANVRVASVEDPTNFLESTIDVLSWPGIPDPSSIQDLAISAPSRLDPGAVTGVAAFATLADGSVVAVPASWSNRHDRGTLDSASSSSDATYSANPTYTHDRDTLSSQLCCFEARLTVDIAYDISDFTTSPSPITVTRGGTVTLHALGAGADPLWAFWNDNYFALDVGLLQFNTFTAFPYISNDSIFVVVATMNVSVGHSRFKTFPVTVIVPAARARTATPMTAQEPAIRAAADCVKAGDVFAHNGEEHVDEDVLDLFVKGRGEANLAMTRFYRHQIDFDGCLGQRWDFDYNEHLDVQTNGDVVHQDGAGRVDTYALNTDGTYTTPREFFNRLLLCPDGTFVLREPDGFKRFFDSGGKLTSRVDRNGNAITFTYDSNGRLDQAFDPFGRTFKFNWNPTGTSEAWRTSRDGPSRMATTPTTTSRPSRRPRSSGQSTGNDFPQGRTRRYSYTSGYTDPLLNHSLKTITEPDDVANGGPPSVTVTYGTDPADASSYNKVVSVLQGGTNESGVPAGGTWRFQYGAVTNPGAEGLPATVVKKTTVTDPADNVTVHGFDMASRLVATRQLTRGFRAGEPTGYTTVTEFNSDSLPTLVTLPLGNQIQ